MIWFFLIVLFFLFSVSLCSFRGFYRLYIVLCYPEGLSANSVFSYFFSHEGPVRGEFDRTEKRHEPRDRTQFVEHSIWIGFSSWGIYIMTIGFTFWGILSNALYRLRYKARRNSSDGIILLILFWYLNHIGFLCIPKVLIIWTFKRTTTATPVPQKETFQITVITYWNSASLRICPIKTIDFFSFPLSK